MALPAPQHPPNDSAVGGTITFTPEGYAQLEILAAERGETPAEYIQAAIGLAQWVDQVLDDGGSMVVRRKRGPWEVLRAKRR